MDTDYRDAAERHWSDARFLLSDSRAANADHLAGLAAECALKAVMLALGMRMKDGRPASKAHGHVNILWEEFFTFADHRSGVRYSWRFAADSTPFYDWSIDDRYARSDGFALNAVRLRVEAARTTIMTMQDAILDGVIE